jgi:hypothetical protein
MSCNYIEIIHSSKHMTHFECHMAKRISSRELEEQRIYFMVITIVEYIQDMKTQSITSTIIYNMKIRLKSVFMEYIKKCVRHDG